MLKFKGAWRFKPPPDGKWINQSIPMSAIGDVYTLISKIASQGNRQNILEHFKGAFGNVKGIQHVWSSSASWAETDLQTSMENAADNAPLFLEAFYDACISLAKSNPDLFVPEAEIINDLCAKHNVGYEIRPPDLVLRETDFLLSEEMANVLRELQLGEKIASVYIDSRSDSGVFFSSDSKSIRLSVFLCHASGDKPRVRELYQRLHNDGFSPWLDEVDLLPGQDWQQEIPKAVRESDIVLVCLSKASINKTGYIQKEIKYALDVADEQPEGTIFIIPLRLEECDVPNRLRKWQWVDLFVEEGYQRLILSLKARATAKAKTKKS